MTWLLLLVLLAPPVFAVLVGAPMWDVAALAAPLLGMALVSLLVLLVARFAGHQNRDDRDDEEKLPRCR